jgi:hypothetical protein
MPHRSKLFGVLAATGIMGLAVGPTSVAFADPMGSVQPAQSANQSYTYSPTLISRYTSGCTSKVQSRGKTLAQAKQMCQCSINQMQQQHSQGDAVALLIRAQFSSGTDPKTGLPFALSKYFTPCMS